MRKREILVIHVYLPHPLPQNVSDAVDEAALAIARAAYGDVEVKCIQESLTQDFYSDSVALKYEVVANA